MGTTNLLSSLKSKYATLTGDLGELQARIQRINDEHAKLSQLEAEAESLKEGIGHVAAVIRMVEPEWDEKTIAPRPRFTRQLPMRPGESAQWTYEILREAKEPMAARDIAAKVLARAGVMDPSRQLLQRATNTVTASLRQHRGNLVESDTSWPKRWRII